MYPIYEYHFNGFFIKDDFYRTPTVVLKRIAPIKPERYCYQKIFPGIKIISISPNSGVFGPSRGNLIFFFLIWSYDTSF